MRELLRSTATLALSGLKGLFRLVWGALGLALKTLIAIALAFEEWGWRPLLRLASLFARLKPIAAFEARIVRLPPYAALAVFALPSALLLPLKLLALYLLASGHKLLALGLLGGAKIAGTAFVARIFMLTQIQLMQIWWFARLYNWFMPWKEALLGWVRASWAWRYGRVMKARAKKAAKRVWLLIQPMLVRWRSELVPALRRRLDAARRSRPARTARVLRYRARRRLAQIRIAIAQRYSRKSWRL